MGEPAAGPIKITFLNPLEGKVNCRRGFGLHPRHHHRAGFWLRQLAGGLVTRPSPVLRVWITALRLIACVALLSLEPPICEAQAVPLDIVSVPTDTAPWFKLAENESLVVTSKDYIGP